MTTAKTQPSRLLSPPSPRWTIIVVTAVSAHTMFLKLDTFFLEPNSTGTVQLINGDFDLSENVITP